MDANLVYFLIFSFFFLTVTFQAKQKLDQRQIEDKKQEVLHELVIGDIQQASKSTHVDLKRHLHRWYKSYEVTPELIKYFIDNYQSAFLKELENRSKRHKGDPNLNTPIQKQLSVERMTARMEHMRVTAKQGSVD